MTQNLSFTSFPQLGSMGTGGDGDDWLASKGPLGTCRRS